MGDATDAAATNPDEPAADEPVAEDTLHGVVVTESCGQRVCHPDRHQVIDLLGSLRTDGYQMCLDVFGVDYLTHPHRSGLPASVHPERFEVVYLLINHDERSRIRLRVQVPESDPVVPTASALHPGTEAPEREVFDMFGISFDGHPDMTRILMPDDWVGHPLRKDYDVGRIPVQFKGAPAAR